jgi:NAD(P)-dependent dehydrogenase (short-subunit alcohol dehydrogenase family)
MTTHRRMDLHLSDKVAIVTGASRGIGRAIAQALASEGMRLTLVARSRDQLEQLAGSLATRCLVQAVDLLRPDAPAGVVAETISELGRIDLLVNNAGATKRGDFFELSDRDWDDGFGLKFFGAMRCCRAAWPHLRATRGSIVNIAGIGGRTGTAEFTIGGSVNAAMLNLTKALADRGVRDGVRVNAINPGGIATDRLQARLRSFASERGVDLAEAEQEMAREFGIARFGEPAEIARMVTFLASPQAAYCHGAIVDVDGGQTRTL